MSDTKEKRNGNARGRPFQPGNPGGPGRPRGVPNKLPRDMRAWLAGELEERLPRLLEALDAPPCAHCGAPDVMLLRWAFEWTFGKAPQAVDLAVTSQATVQVYAQAVERRLTVFEGLKRAIDRGIITLDTAHAIEATMEELPARGPA